MAAGRQRRKRLPNTVLSEDDESAMMPATPLGSGIQMPESWPAQFQGSKSSTRLTGWSAMLAST